MRERGRQAKCIIYTTVYISYAAERRGESGGEGSWGRVPKQTQQNEGNTVNEPYAKTV